MKEGHVVGIDIGGTNIRAGMVRTGEIHQIESARINAKGSADSVLDDLYRLTDSVFDPSVEAIGIGVPSVLDLEKGIVYDVQNIPSWKEVPLRKLMEDRYDVPVLINNDANCFVLGEKYFGKCSEFNSLIGLIIGTGLGAGIIIDNHLYSGPNCGAGEFGMVDYLDQYYEYYACGQFFQNIYHTDGEDVFNRAKVGDERAFEMYQELGMHLGNAIKMILYTYDPEMIIFGGSVRHAYPYFSEAMWKRIQTFAYPKSLEGFKIELSDLENGGILGAAALYYDYSKRD